MYPLTKPVSCINMILDHLLYFLAEYRFFVPLGVFFFMGALRLLGGKLRPFASGWFYVFAGTVFTASIVFLVKGTEINAAYVYKNGLSGQGQVIGSRTTSTQINDHDVIAFKTLLKLQDGQVLETEFTSASCNFYPAGDYPIPTPGQEFSVRYAKHRPENFIIVTNDMGSEYGRTANCAILYQKLFEAEAAFRFDSTNAGYRNAFIQEIEVLQDSPCDTNMKNMYHKVLKTL